MVLLSVTNRVLQVPELLDTVCSHLDNISLVRAARVNKTWSPIALSFLWRELDDPRPLFRLLAPGGFEYGNGKFVRSASPPLILSYSNFVSLSPKDFKTLPTEDNWTRFEHYSRRIRSLSIDDTDEKYSLIFDKFARLRPLRPLFPSLRKLEWIAPNENSLTQRSVLFMHDSVRDFSLTLPPIYAHHPSASLRQYFNHFVGRMPLISRLAILMKGYAANIEKELVALTLALKDTLTTLVVPRYFTTSTLIEAAASLPHLTALASHDSIAGVHNAARRFVPNLPAGSFPSLVSLELGVPFVDLVQWFRKGGLPATLQHLTITTPRLEGVGG
ncbi:hypothetical protein CC1G_05617 [Coprinopsis cinerea okayama7|uniref:F-box domain-containing protein n=1 Tax=Coprinopsis cinerea (strain Okayama-7 / 130 / ATCC MYA-4618 / FGSC 9003) TaxID=240176 RepID=A8P1N1_COPC7|nr:hypothetical protein CC1G_05617 [Coprinopsis cinerea okayama7\|eukprot:XP_001838136.1 hypothetical protein CC1G_05617 [Coprinopsis cinerea okayama7\